MSHLPLPVLVLALALSPLASASAPKGPSFDCAKAAAPVEQAICADPNLSAVDLELSENYSTALAASGPYRNDLVAFQRAWLKRRAPECGLTPSDPVHPPDSSNRISCLLGLIKDRADSLKPPTYGYFSTIFQDVRGSPPLTLWLLAEAFAELPFAPKAAEHVFASIDAEPAQLGYLMTARLFDPPSDASSKLQQDLAAKLIDASRSKEILPETYDGSVLGLVPFIQSAGAELNLPCALFEQFPDLIPATDSAFGGTRDNFLPRAACSDYEYPYPHGAAELDVAAAPYDGGQFDRFRCTGTLAFAYFAIDRKNELITRAAPKILLQPGFRFPSKQPPPRHTYVPPTPANIPLESWSYQSVWNRHVFASFKQLYDKALMQFTSLYQTRWHFAANDAEHAARVALWLPLLWTDEAPKPKPIAIAIMGPNPAHTLPPLLTGKLPEQESGEPLLSLAVENTDAVELLLAAHADPNAINDFGKTPLMTAAQFDQGKTIALLLKAGAHINQQTIEPENIPDNDTRPGKDQGVGCSAYQILHGSRTALMYAAANASLPAIQQLLAAGADKTLKDSQGLTAADYLQGKGPVPTNSYLTNTDRMEATKLLMVP